MHASFDAGSIRAEQPDPHPWQRGMYVCRLLSETKGNVAEAARKSGLGRNAIYEVLRQNGIALASFRGNASATGG